MTHAKSDADIFFVSPTPLGFDVRVTLDYWKLITTIKHPVMAGLEKQVQKTLEHPDEIRRSRSDPAVHLFYSLQRPSRWLCAVAKRLNGDGFLITTYPTDAIKEGIQLWPR